MRRLSTVCLGLFVCMAGPSSDARARGKKEAAPSQGMMMPDLQAVLGDAYEVPPELTSRAAPGHILRRSDKEIEIIKSGCVARKPGEHDVTSINMQSQLSGGVRMNMGLGRIKGQASSFMALNFQSPYIQAYEEADFTLTRQCVKLLKRKARTESVTDLVVVKEVMMARINGCKKFETSLDVGLAGRGVSASAGSSCEMISDAPVVIGYRTVPVMQMVKGLVSDDAQGGGAAKRPLPPLPPAGRLVSAGKWHSCGVYTGTGVVNCWGLDKKGRTKYQKGSFQAVSAASEVSCGLRTDGKVKCWGDNMWRQKKVPKATFVSVSAFGSWSCGVTDSGAVKCWGHEGGRIGLQPPPGEFRSVSVGGGWACGVMAAGGLRCWGVWDPPANPPSGTFKSVSAGESHACAVTEMDEVKCWGDNKHGQTTSPAGRFYSVSAGYRHSCGVAESGAVKCWGSNKDGQLNAPEGKFSSVDTGLLHTCAVTSEDKIRCWGDNEYGQAPGWLR